MRLSKAVAIIMWLNYSGTMWLAMLSPTVLESNNKVVIGSAISFFILACAASMAQGSKRETDVDQPTR